MRLILPRLSIVSLALGVLLLGAPRELTAQTPLPAHPARQWKSAGGHLDFRGVAKQRKGNYVALQTASNLDIWLPIGYLSAEDQAFLDSLASGAPQTPSDTSSPDSPRPALTDMADMADMADNAGSTPDQMPPSGFGQAPDSDSSTDDPAADNGAETESDATPQSFSTGDDVEILVDGQWLEGKIFAVNPARQQYFVSYTQGGAPRSRWVPANILRAPGDTNAPAPAPATTGNPPAPAPADTGDASPDTSSTSTPAFRRGQAVEIWWGNRWYPGKIVRVQGSRYFISYNNYGENWNEWVTPDRLRPPGSNKPGPTTPTRPGPPSAGPRAEGRPSGPPPFPPGMPEEVRQRIEASRARAAGNRP